MTDWERVCLGNLVGMPVVVVPTGLKSIEDPPKGGTRRRTTVTTGIYAPPDHDHIVSFFLLVSAHTKKAVGAAAAAVTDVLTPICFLAGIGPGDGLPVRHQSQQTAAADR